MVANRVFRVYKDEETMLKVYGRRLGMADALFTKGESKKHKNLKRYENEATEAQHTDRGHRVNVTKGIGIIDTLYSSMVAVDVEFICKVIGNGTQVQTLAAERGLNQAWRDTKGQERTKEGIKDALLVDIGWVKVYYDYVEDVETQESPTDALIAEAMQLRKDNPDAPDEELMKLLTLTKDVAVVLRDRVCVDYVPWEDIRYDPAAKRIDDCRWVAQYTRLPVPEVTQNPTWRAFVEDRYGEKKGRRMMDDLKGDTSVLTGLEGSFNDIEGLGKDDTDDDQRITVVEMWDLETGIVTTFPKDVTTLTLYQRLNPLMLNLDLQDRNPFKPLVVRDDPDCLEGIGDMRVLMPSLVELDEYRSNVATYVARSIPKLIGPKDALGAEGKKALESRVWGEFVGLEEGTTRQEVGNMDIPALPQEVYQVQEGIEMEMKEATGASEPMRGVFPSKRTTAAEAQIVTSAGEQRQAERRGRLANWYLAIAKTMLQLMQLNYDQKRMLRFTDDLGQEFTWQWDKSDIAIDADIDISLTPKEDLTRGERVQRAFQWMNLALPLPETDRAEVLRWVGREMGMRDEEIRSMVKTPDQVAAEQAQQQVAEQLAVAPQQHGGAPPGLSITPSGGGG
jgi:hypothetical protein